MLSILIVCFNNYVTGFNQINLLLIKQKKGFINKILVMKNVHKTIANFEQEIATGYF